VGADASDPRLGRDDHRPSDAKKVQLRRRAVMGSSQGRQEPNHAEKDVPETSLLASVRDGLVAVEA